MELDLDVMKAGARALARRLEGGEDVNVMKRSGERILRVEWLNLYNEPSMLYSIAGCILWDSDRLGVELRCGGLDRDVRREIRRAAGAPFQ